MHAVTEYLVGVNCTLNSGSPHILYALYQVHCITLVSF